MGWIICQGSSFLAISCIGVGASHRIWRKINRKFMNHNTVCRIALSFVSLLNTMSIGLNNNCFFLLFLNSYATRQYTLDNIHETLKSKPKTFLCL